MTEKSAAMKTLFFIIFALLLAFQPARAQEIDLSLEITMDALSPSQKDYLKDFQEEVRKYIVDHRWTDVDFKGDQIPVSMSINFISGTDQGGEVKAQIVVVSERRVYENGRPTPNTNLILRLLDPEWTFDYRQGRSYIHDEFQFDALTSVLDFYMYVVIGMDFDSYELLQGSPYYQKALLAAQRSQSGGRSSEWQGQSNQYSRMNLITELLNLKYESYRRAMYWYYYEGIDFLQTEPTVAKKSIARAIDLVAESVNATSSRSILCTQWLESHSMSFCELLKDYPERAQVMQRIIQVDPQRQEVYSQCIF